MRPTIRVLDDAQLELVLDEALRILAQVGVVVAGRSLRERLLDEGFGQDDATGRVLFPSDHVRAAIERAPGAFTLHDRDGQPALAFGAGETHFAPGSSGLDILDHRSGQHRRASTADFIELVKVGQGLRHVDMLATAFSPDEVEPRISDAWRLYLLLRYGTKPFISGVFTEESVPRIVQLMQLYRRDAADLAARPMAVCTITSAGQFTYNEDTCQNLLDYIEAGIPVEIVPITLMGLNAPVTVLGATAFHTAEVLAGITMTQLLRPGHPTVFGGAAAAFHMQNTTSAMTAIEALRLTSAASQMGKHLGFPTQSYTGFSEAKVLDAQAGVETTLGALLAVTSGMDSVSGPGMLDYLLTFSLPKLVVDDEIAGQVRHFGRDVSLADDIPTTAVIQEMLGEGHVLVADHTMEHWPSELYLPGPTWDREPYDKWQEGGATSVGDRAAAEVERLLEAYTGPEVDPAVDREARAIIEAGLTDGSELPAL